MTFAMTLLLASCSSWFSDDSKSNLDGECVGKDYVVLNDLITAPYQNCTTSSECPSGSYCEADSNVHHTAATGAICYWQCYADSDCGFGNHCDCAGQCQALDGDAGPQADPSCPRDEGLLASINENSSQLSAGSSTEWQFQEAVSPLTASFGSGADFTSLGGGTLGVAALNLGSRLTWEADSPGGDQGSYSYLQSDVNSLDIAAGASVGGRVVFRVPSGAYIESEMDIVGKRDQNGRDGTGWNLEFDGDELMLRVYDGTTDASAWDYLGQIGLSGSYGDGEWHFVEFVVDRSTNQLRARSDLDNLIDPSDLNVTTTNVQDISTLGDLSTTGSLRVGSWGDDGGWPGTVQGLQVTHLASFTGPQAQALASVANPDNSFWDTFVANASSAGGGGVARSCLYNEDCPYGAKCSDDTKTCVFSCLSTDHPDQGCVGGTVCDCFGDCVEPGAVTVRSSKSLPFLEVLPRDVPVAGEVFEARRVSVNLVTENSDVAAAAVATNVTITAPADIEVSCDAESRTTGNYAPSCVLNTWIFEAQGARNRSAGSVWVRSVAGSTSEQTSWTLKLTSAGTTNHIAYVVVREFDVAGLTPPVFAEAGEYRGRLTRRAVGDTTTYLLPDETMPLSVPVRAWVSATSIDLYDETKAISPSGWLRLDSSQDRRQELLHLPSTGNAPALATGSIVGTIRSASISRTFDSAKGLLAGGFLMEVIGSTRWEFDLVRAGDGEACLTDSDCGTGEGCNEPLCMPTPAWSEGSWVASPLLSEERGVRWVDALKALVAEIISSDPENSTLDLVADTYSKERGVARLPGAAVPVIGVSTLKETMSSMQAPTGYQLAASFAGAKSAMTDAVLGDTNSSVTSMAIYVLSQFGHPLEEILYSSFTRDSFQGDPKVSLVPCVDTSRGIPGSAPTGIWIEITQSDAYLNSNYRFDCASLYANHMAANQASGSYDSFLESSCVLSNYDLSIEYEEAGNSIYDGDTGIFLCPFADALWGAEEPYSKAEKLACFVANATGLVLESALFGEVVGRSGDLGCGAQMGQQRSVVLEENGDTTGTSLSACLADLAIEPTLFTDALTAVNGLERFQTLFSGHQCFSPANFYGALAELTGGLMFTPQDWPLGGFTETDGPDRQRLLTHLLRQWTQLHTFIAREGTQAEAMAKTLRHRVDLGVAEQEAVDTAPGYEALLDESERGWQLLLSFQNIVANFQDEDALLNPDYRPLASQTTSADHEQNIGLPVFITEGLAAHMLLVSDYTRSVHESAYGECYDGAPSQETRTALERAQRAMHYANAVSETWDSLVAAAVATPDWLPRWQRAQLEFQATRSQAWSAIRNLTTCREPGTISEQDVPLFFGDANGTSSRYFAASDYLLSGWAVPAVQSAISALDQARGAFMSKRNSQFQDEMTELEAARRLENLSAQYGRQILELCGISNIESSDALNRINAYVSMAPNAQSSIDLDNCHIDYDNPLCTDGLEGRFYPPIVDAPPASAGDVWVAPQMLTDVQIKFALCRSETLRPNIGLLLPSGSASANENFTYQRLTEQTDQFRRAVRGQTYASISLPRSEDGLYVRPTDSLGDEVDLSSRNFFRWQRDATNLSSSPEARAAVAATTVHCASDPYFDGKAYSLEQPEDTSLDPVCYRGVIGESILAILSAQTQIEAARADVERIGEDIRNLQSNCFEDYQGMQYLQRKQSAFNEEQEERRAMLERADRAWGAIGAIGAAVSLQFDPAAHRALLETAHDEWGFGSIVTEADLRREQTRHDEAMTAASDHLEFEGCMRHASLSRSSFRGAYLNIKAAQESVDAALLRLRNLYSTATRVAMEGQAAVAREEGRFAPSYAHHYWLDEHIDAFERDFSYAKRITFMALKAVEYEFQQSLGIRDEILGATTPEQLQDAIVELRQEQITRTINSRRPEDSQLVLSLRDQILQLVSGENANPGERAWTPTQRFVDRLWDDQNAVFDDDGKYLGQGITFTLAPDGALEYRCGERLWDLTATLQGDLLDVDAPNTSLFLIRNNSFGSQWCDGRGDEASMQVASMQPTSSLFEDDERGGSEAFGMNKITAMLQPWFNVPRSDFYKEQYSEGSSEEFAGRGLYGEYTILFPWKGLLEDGFPLERVEDILIRFDYISVDNLTNL